MQSRPSPDPEPRRPALAALRVVAAIVAVIGAVVVLGGLLNGTGPGATGSAATSAAATSSSALPVSSSPAALDPVLVAAGDIGRCDATTDDDTGALAQTIPGAVVTLGDTAYEDGTADELQRCFGGSWGGVKDRIRYAITGNHDIHTDNGAPLRAYMGDAAARDGRTWFSEDLASWHLVVLDGNCGAFGGRCGASSDQVKWLREDLAASAARCTLALWHQPRFSSGSHGNDSAVGPLWDALSAAGADLVLNGHDHDYERFAPQDPDGTADATRGITEIVVGTGGATLEPFTKGPASNSAVRIDDAYGVLELTLGSDGWSFRFLDTTGTVRDQGSGICH